MSEEESAVGVAPKYINDQPRIVISFYKDSNLIQEIEDDDGRKMVSAAFEPEAAHSTLAKKIKEARVSLRRMSGVADP